MYCSVCRPAAREPFGTVPYLFIIVLLIGSGYRTARGSLNFKTYSTTSCNAS